MKSKRESKASSELFAAAGSVSNAGGRTFAATQKSSEGALFSR
jgi:hypothetical protein